MNTIVPYNMPLPASPEAAEYSRPPQAPSLRYWLGVVLSRVWLASAVGLALFLVVVAVGSQLPRTYYAEGSILVQPRRINLAEADQTQSGLPADTGAVDTEVEVLKSRALSEVVIQKLGLDKDPEFNPPKPNHWSVGFAPQWPFVLVRSSPPAAPAAAGIPPSIVDAVQRRTMVRRIGLTYVVQIGFSSGSPSKAVEIADAVIAAYLARQVITKTTAVTAANEELNSNVDRLRQSASAAAAAEEEYKNDHGLLSAQGATMAESEVSTLNQQIAAARADRAERDARLNAALVQVGHGSGGDDIGAALGSDTIKELRKKEAEVSAQVADLEVRFKPDYPELKRAEAEMTDVHEQIQREINRIVSSLRADAHAASERENSLLGSRVQAQGGLSSNNRALVGLVALEQRADAAKKIYETYLDRASEVAAARSLQQADATINYQAALSPNPPSPNMRLVTAFAVLLGLAGAAAAILLSEFWSRKLRSRADIERDIGLPLAAALPDFASAARVHRRLTGAGPADYIADYPFTAFAEAFRNLRAFLVLSDPVAPSKIIAITSAVPREGKSMTSMCLARTLALTGAKVILIDCDLRQRGATKLAGEPEMGLVEVLEHKIPLEKALIRDAKSGAFILPAANRLPIPHDLFGRKETWDLFRMLAEGFDHVILDTPPVLGVADGRILAAKADKVLYLVEWNRTPASAAQSAVQILRESGAHIAGVILAKVNIRQQGRYGYGDSSDYFRYYQRYYLTGT